MKNWKRTLTIGLVWGFICFGWYWRDFFKTNWEFDIFSLWNWSYVVDEFRKGWAISQTSDWIFLGSLCLMVVIYIVGFRWALKIKWMEWLHRVVNKLIYFFTGSNVAQKESVKITLNKKSSKNTRPKAMDSSIIRPVVKNTELKVPVDTPSGMGGNNFSTPSQSMGGFGGFPMGSDFPGMPSSQGFGAAPHPQSFSAPSSTGFSFDSNMKNNFTPPKDSPFGTGFGAPSMRQGLSMAPSPFDEDDFDKILLEDIKIPERKRLDENMDAILGSSGYEILRNIKLGGLTIDYLAIGMNRVVVCQIDPEDGDWLADEERFNGEDPLWFSESSHRVSPVFNLIEQVKKFTERLAVSGFTGTVAPVFVEKKGTIINAEDMLSTWKEMAIAVCRTDIGGPDELKSFQETIVPDMKPTEEVLAMVHNAL